MTHEYEPQHGCDECARCSMPADTHPTVLTEVPEPSTTGALLAEDHVNFWDVPCPVCKVQSGSCVSRGGYYRPAHPQRLAKARAA